MQLFSCKPTYFLGENVHTKLTSACISLQGRIFEWCSYGLVNTTCKVKQHHFSLAVWLNLYKIYRKKYPLLLMLLSVCRNNIYITQKCFTADVIGCMLEYIYITQKCFTADVTGCMLEYIYITQKCFIASVIRCMTEYVCWSAQQRFRTEML